MDCNPNQEVKKDLYGIENYFKERSVRFLTKNDFYFLT